MRSGLHYVGVVPKNNGTTFVSTKISIVPEKIKKDKLTLSDLPQISGRTLEKTNVLVQYPNYRNTLPFGIQITECKV